MAEQRQDSRDGKRQDRLLPPGKDVGHRDRRHGPDAAGNQHEREQVEQEHCVEGRRCLHGQAVGNHQRTAEQKEAPAREPDGLGELVGEDPVRRGRRGQQVSRLARVEQRGVHDDPAREEEHDQQREEEHAEEILDDRVGQVHVEADELEPAQEEDEQTSPEHRATEEDHRDPQPRALDEVCDRVAHLPPAQPAQGPGRAVGGQIGQPDGFRDGKAHLRFPSAPTQTAPAGR